MLRKAGWIEIEGGKGSHTKWRHAAISRALILSGNDGDDAKRYQEKDVQIAVHEAKTGKGDKA